MPRRAPPIPQKSWLVEANQEREYELSFDEDNTIGRAYDNLIVILNDPTASRYHAVIRHTGGVFMIIPQRNRVPIEVNEFSISKAQQLQHGDEILIGETIFRFVTT